MSVLKRLWIKMVWFAEALEGVDDPAGNYMLALGKRVDKLEREMGDVKRQLRSGAGGGGIQQ